MSLSRMVSREFGLTGIFVGIEERSNPSRSILRLRYIPTNLLWLPSSNNRYQFHLCYTFDYTIRPGLRLYINPVPILEARLAVLWLTVTTT